MLKWQAARIARTETVGLFGAGSTQAMRDAGLEQKEWLSARDDVVRESHGAIDGTRVGVHADFVLENGSGPYPGAISDVSENVNCRCQVIPVIPPAAEKE